MTAALSAAVGSLFASQLTLAGESCSYRRGNDSIDTLDAIPTKPQHVEYSDEETSITSRELDFLIWTEDLVIDGDRTVPQRGDQIERTDPTGIKRNYEVLPRDGDRCYRPTDTTMLITRIYTVEIPVSTES